MEHPEAAPFAADAAFFSTLEAETRFYIVRHGQSEANARSVVQGLRDFPLDASGRAQAAAVGAWLAGEGIAEVLCSPLSRAAETARIIARAAGLGEPRVEPTLVELDVGVFSGLSLEEARSRFPEAYADFESRSWDGVPGAESSALLYDRAMEAWSRLRERAASGSRALAVVSHGGFIQWLFRSTFGCRSWMPLLPTGNCCVFELLVAPTGGGRPAYLQWRRVNFQASPLPSVSHVF